MSRAGLASLKAFSSSLRTLPRVLAQRITEKAAPLLTQEALKTFDASENAYGVPWRPGSEGQRVTLRKSGSLARYIHYVAIGTRLRVALGVAYAKYQVGRRPIFPSQSAGLPPAYQKILADVAQRETAAFLAEASR